MSRQPGRGRFSDPLARRFNDSIRFDIRLWAADIAGSKAYAAALGRAGIITAAEAEALQKGLAAVEAEFAAKRFNIQPDDEDIHAAVERRLGELIGPEIAGKLHTGRSRNDQVATDTRLWLKEQIDRLEQELTELQQAILGQAETHLAVIMPGYTHLQQAQPVRFSHWLLSYGWMFRRDQERLTDLTRRVDMLPLGSGALSGNSLGIDREFLAGQLGFAAISANSMDAVGDRDYLLEFLSWAAILQTHLSRLAEDLIIFGSAEFGFVELAEAYATGSSLMPQKKNPGSLELIRGKTGRINGHLIGLLTTLKGQPSTYNKDMQEDKEPLFDTVDTLRLTLPITAGVIRTLKVNRNITMDSAMLATELVDYLVEKGVSFRQAHHLVGQIVQWAISQDQPLYSLPLAAYQQVSDLFEPDVYEWLTFQRAVERRVAPGGTAESAVRKQLELLRRLVAE